MIALSPTEWIGLSIYIGFIPAARRAEMARYGINYDAVCSSLTAVGLMTNGKINMVEARAAFKAKFPTVLGPSQLHHVFHELGMEFKSIN
jgi:hypothetical protein